MLSEMKKSRKANNWKVPVSYSPLDAPPDHSVFIGQPASERRAPPRPFQALSTASFAYQGSMPAKSPRASPEEASRAHTGKECPILDCPAFGSRTTISCTVQYKYRRVSVIKRNSTRKHVYCYYGIIVYNIVAMTT